MKFRFSKRILENYKEPIHGHFEHCIVYSVYSNEEIIGTFLCSEKVAFIDFGQSLLRIDITHHNFKSDKYVIVDNRSNVKVGEYRIPIWLGGIMKLGTLILDGKECICKQLKPDVRYSPMLKSTWGHFKIRISNADEEVIYKLKVDVPFIEISSISQRPFDGEIETNTKDHLMLFCGLFLIEQVLEIRDRSIVE